MKIGLLTFHDTSNFGAMLQTYGLYKCLILMGHECEIINYQCEAILKRELPPSWRFTLNPKEIIKELCFYPKDRKRYAGIRDFRNNYISMSEPLTKESIKDVENRYDVLMTGSDMVWALNITGEDYTYFLDFVSKDKIKCSYGSSIGAEWTDDQKKRIKELLASFSVISVREEITSLWLRRILEREINIVCDPTMLLRKEDWEIIKNNKYKNQKYILVYFNDSNGKCLKDAIAKGKEKGLPVYLVNGYIPSLHYKSLNVYTIEDFLSLLFYADYVFTASYHGLLFSLYFKKQFTYYEREPATRMKFISEKFGLTDRNGSHNLVDDKPIEYSVIEREIEDYRASSKSLLSKMISNGDNL